MKQAIRFVVVLSCLVTLSYRSAWAEGTGLKEPTPAQAQWMREHFPSIKKLRANHLALERANEARRARGQGLLLDASVELAPFGEEAVFDGVTAGTGQADAAALAAGVGAVDNSADAAFPPIRSQGSIGSCVAWATTYYQLTHETAKARGWNAKTGGDLYRFSPKWTYNMINGGVDGGAYYSDAYNVELKHGAARWSEFVYDSNYLAWCTNTAAWRTAIESRPLSQGSISGTDDTLINNIKAHLLNGHVAVISTYVNSWVSSTLGNDASTTNDDLFVSQRIATYMSNTANGGHAMTVVGYSDDLWCDINGNGLVEASEKGALKIANSWGTGDWNAGYRWVAYDAVRRTSTVTGFAPTNRGGSIFRGSPYTITARASYTPKLVAEFTLTHAARNQLYLRLGLSNTGTTTPTTTWYPGAIYGDGGALNFAGAANGATTATFVFDFSDIATTATRWYFVMQDSATGNPATCSGFVLTDVENGSVQTAATVPMVPATSDGSTANVFVDYTRMTLAPTIVTQPASQSVVPDQTATFTVAAIGQATLMYQWQRSDDAGVTWYDIAGATAASYPTPPAACTDNGSRYRCVVTNPYGSVTSASATLTVNCVPVITKQPTNVTVKVGQTATFSVTATGAATLLYQWQRSNDRGKTFTNIAGANAAAYSKTVVSADNSARFRCIVQNGYGTVTSSTATLSVSRK